VRAHRPNPAIGYLLVLVAVGAFVVNAGVSRIVLTTGISAPELSALRAVGTTVVLGIVIVATGRAHTLRVRRDEVPTLLAYGLVGVALLHMTYFVAIERLPIGLALLLEYLAPVLVALWVRLVRRQPVRAALWPALGLCLVGLALVAEVGAGASTLDPVGVLAGFGAAVSFATYFLLGERMVVHRDPVSTTFWGFAVASVLWSVLVPWWDALGTAAGTSVSLPASIGAGTVPLGLLVAWVAVLGTLVPFGAATAALRHLPATTVTVVAILEPVGAAMLAWWWFDESQTASQLVGVALVLTGIVLALRARVVRTPAPVLSALPPDGPRPQGRRRGAARRD
jgi:drug/metabolite transporter (DMT)-like permease